MLPRQDLRVDIDVCIYNAPLLVVGKSKEGEGGDWTAGKGREDKRDHVYRERGLGIV